MTLRKAFFWTHLAAGLLAGGIILSMAVTGMVLAYEPQIVEWAERDRRIVNRPSGHAPRLPLDELAAAASAASAGGRLSAVTVKADPTAAAMFSFGREGGSLFVNPYTGEVLGGE